jgi:hypothetical protein
LIGGFVLNEVRKQHRMMQADVRILPEARSLQLE